MDANLLGLEGKRALVTFLEKHYQLDRKALTTLRFLALEAAWGEDDFGPERFARLPLNITEFKAAVDEAERRAVEQATTKLAFLKDDLAANTRAWVKASESMQAVIKLDIERLEAEI